MRFQKAEKGPIVPFDASKITNAVLKAMSACGLPSEDMAKKVTRDVMKQIGELNQELVSFEEVQDLVERALMKRGLYDIAKAYIIYREDHAKARKAIKVREKAKGKQDVTDASMLMVQSLSSSTVSSWDRNKITQKLVTVLGLDMLEASSVAKEVENHIIGSGMTEISSAFIRETVNSVLAARGYQGQLKDLTMYQLPREFIDNLMFTKSNENSNIVSNNPEAVSLAISETILRQYALDAVFSSDIRKAHIEGRIHVHDVSFPHRVYCSSHSIEYIKKYGLKGLGNLNTTSKPAKTASVLTCHINTFLASMQAYYAGALGLGYINILYAPLVEGMSYKQLHQTAQELIFNVSQNAFSRGSQTLFVDANLHTGVPKYLADVPAIGAGGRYYAKVDPTGKDWRQGNYEPLTEHVDKDGNWCLLWNTPDDNQGQCVIMREHDGKQVFSEQPWAHVMRYGDYQKEAQAFAHALLDVWGEGDATGHIFEFPKCDFHVNAEAFTDKGQYEVFQHACRLAAKNGSTYFVFDRDSVSLAACCRLKIQITDMSMLSHPEHLRSSFPRNAPVVVRRDGQVEVISMGRLFDEEDTQIIKEDGFEIKQLHDVEIWDRDGWTSLQRVMRHKKTAAMKSDMLRVVRTDSGRLVAMTDNHPVVVVDTNMPEACPKCGSTAMYPMGSTAYGKRVFGCKNCKKYSVGDVLSTDPRTERIVDAETLTTQQAFIDCQDAVVPKTKRIHEDAAYLLGAYVGDGSMFTGHRVCAISKPETHKTYQVASDHAAKACLLAGLSDTRVRKYKDKFTFPASACPETLFAGNAAYYKQLPPDYLCWTERTFGDVISGLVDTDGSTHKTDVVISSISLTLITQIQMYLRGMGIASRMYLANEDPCINNEINGKEGITYTHLSYNLLIRADARVKALFRLSWKVQAMDTATTIKAKWTSCERIYKIQHVTDKCEEYVYDVTTGSHTFVVNGLLQHNCGFQNVTINIPQAAYRADRAGEKTLEGLFRQMDEAMDLAMKAHLQKKEHIAKLMQKGGPLYQLGKSACDARPYLRLEDATYIIGMIGVNDAVQFLTGKQMHEDKDALEMGLKITGHMFLKSKEYTKQYGLQVKLEESPAESAARRLAKADLVFYRPEALTVYKGGDEDHAYYTNSIHMVADADIDLLERAELQAMFNPIIEAGAITHAFIGEQQPSPEAIEKLVKWVFLNTQSAQMTFSPEFTCCNTCGKMSRGLHPKCPICGSDDVVGETRIVGYFSKLSNFNLSKLAENRARDRGKYHVEEVQA